MANQDCKIQSDLHETQYRGVFRAAAFKLEVKPMKDSKCPIQYSGLKLQNIT